MVDPQLGAQPSRPKLTLRLVTGLLDLEHAGEAFFAPLAARADDLVACSPDASAQLEVVLALWAFAPAEDWAGWGARVSNIGAAAASPETAQRRASRAAAVARHLLRHFRADAHDQADTTGLFSVLRPHLSAISAVDAQSVVVAAREALDYAWTGGDAERASQQYLHASLRSLADGAPTLRDALRQARGESLLAEAERGDILQWTCGIAEMAVDVERETQRQLLGLLPDLDETLPEQYCASLWARLSLEKQSHNSDREVNAANKYRTQVGKALGFRSGGRQYEAARNSFAVWMTLNPRASDAVRAARAFGSYPTDTARAAVSAWAASPGHGRSRRNQNTTFIVGLLPPVFNAGRWVGAMQGSAVSETPIVAAIEKELFRERPHPKRLDIYDRRWLAGVVAELGLQTRQARTATARVGIRLLQKGQPGNNIEVVIRLCQALNGEYGGRVALGTAIARHCERHKLKVTQDQADVLIRAGVPLPAENRLTKGARKIAEAAIQHGGKLGGALGKALRR